MLALPGKRSVCHICRQAMRRRTKASGLLSVGRFQQPGFTLSAMRNNYLEEYYSFLRFPSVSTDDQYTEKLVECADWLMNKINGIGLQTQLVPTRRHPIVWARNQHQPGRRSVLIYGHYDVQPPDPLELWDSPPFEPVLKNGYVFARGATDN